MSYWFTFRNDRSEVVDAECKQVPGSRVTGVFFPSASITSVSGQSWHLAGPPTATIEVGGVQHQNISFRRC